MRTEVDRGQALRLQHRRHAEAGQDVRIAGGGAADGPGSARRHLLQQPQAAYRLDGDVGGAMLQVDARRLAAPQLANPLHGAAQRTVGDLGDALTAHEQRHQQAARLFGGAGEELLVERLDDLLLARQPGDRGLDLAETQRFRPDDNRARLADEPQRLGGSDPAMAAGGAVGTDPPVVHPALDRRLADADRFGHLPGGEYRFRCFISTHRH